MARFPESGNLVLTWSASTTALLTVVGLARRPGGSIEPFRATRTHAGDRTSETVTLVEDVASEVLSVTASIAAGVKRGQAYVRLGLVYGGVTHALAAGYVYDGSDLTLGTFVEPGPGGGEGFYQNLIIVQDAAGTTSTTFTPATSNTIRHLYGIILYYDSSADVATRTIGVDIRRPWGALPTGFATAVAANIWSRAPLVLTASQEGTFAFYGRGGAGTTSFNDQGGNTHLSEDTLGLSLPFVVLEDDPMVIVMGADSGNANDRYSAYALVEDWLVP